MSRKKSSLTITDQFCGAGGSSQGARQVAKRIPGIEISVALNHWKLAIETHATNFPDTYHDCTDISACDPRRYPSTNGLLTSPECTNQTLAKGKKRVRQQMDLYDKGILDPAAERSRATMWDVCRFAEYHNYNFIIVENVVEARHWVMWDAWIKAMELLNYNYKCVFFNSMFAHPCPQSRDRMYVVFWKKGQRAPNLDITPQAYCPKCNKNVFAVQSWKAGRRVGKYIKQYLYCCPTCSMVVKPYYYAAFNCIDWSDLGTLIRERKKPLSPNTRRRAQYGLDTYYGQSFVINDQHSTGVDFRVNSVYGKIPTINSMPHLKLVMPFLAKSAHSGSPLHGHHMNNVFDVGMTETTHHNTYMVTPPFIIKTEQSSQESYDRNVFEANFTQSTWQTDGLITPRAFIVELNSTGKARRVMEHISTVLGGGNHHALVIENKGQSTSRPLTDAISTQTSTDYLGLLTSSALKAFLAYNYNGNQTSSLLEATDAVTAKDRMSLFSSFADKPSLEDCYYRMIKPHEIQRAMAFDDDYKILGSGRDKVRQCGNAVTPPVMEILVERVVQSLNSP